MIPSAEPVKKKPGKGGKGSKPTGKGGKGSKLKGK